MLPGTVVYSMSEQLTEQEKRILEFFQRLVRRLKADWWRFVLFALVLGLVGAAYAFTLPTQYLAQVTVFLVQSSSAEAQAQELLGRGPKPNQGYAAAILRSRTVAGYVASALKLGPEWSPHRLSASLKIRGTQEGMLAIFFECADQEMAAKILGEYLRAYRRYTDNTVLTVAQGERKFVEEQLSKSKSELEQAESKLIAFESGRRIEKEPDVLRNMATAYYQQRPKRKRTNSHSRLSLKLCGPG